MRLDFLDFEIPLLKALRLDDRNQAVINRRVTEDIVLDIGEDGRIIGIAILDASKHVPLEQLLPVKN